MNGADAQEAFERLARTATTTRDLAVHTGATRWEVFCKASAVRELTFRPDPPLEISFVRETGVAIRTVERGTVGFGAAAGLDTEAARSAVESAQSTAAPLPVDPLPPRRLLDRVEPVAPPAAIPTGWTTHVAEALTAGIAASSERTLSIRRLVLREGTYGWLLTTGDEFVAHHQGSATSLEVEIAANDGGRRWRDWLWIRDPESFNPQSAAATMTDRVLLEAHAPAPHSGLADLLFHPEVCAHLLAGLGPLFRSRSTASDPLPRILDRHGRLASPAVSVVDDRVSPDSPGVAPCDGEGLPPRRTLLLDRGIPRHRVASHLDAQMNGDPPRGGAQRVSYRDYPSTGFGGLRLISDVATPPARLLHAEDRMLYLLRPLAPVAVDAEHDEVRIVASGVWLDHGRVAGAHPVAEVRAGLAQFLRSIDGVGADGAWFETACGFVEGATIRVRCQRVVG
jgi:PmbA protein